MSREKSDFDNRRVIVDLNWLKGASINNNVSDNTYARLDFILTLPNINQVVRAIKKFGKGSFMSKIAWFTLEWVILP